MSSFLNEEKATCPECKAESRFGAYRFIDAISEPELKERVLDDSLFGWKCPSCGYACRVYYDTVIHDANKSYAVTLESAPDARSLPLDDRMQALPNRDRLRLVTSGVELKEKIRIFDADLDDRALEGYKCFLLGNLEIAEGSQAPDAFVFDSLDGDQIQFTAYADGKRLGLFAAPDTVYRSMAQDLLAAYGPERDEAFLAVDMRWALEAFKEIAHA